jgi:hypothetical protein
LHSVFPESEREEPRRRSIRTGETWPEGRAGVARTRAKAYDRHMSGLPVPRPIMVAALAVFSGACSVAPTGDIADTDSGSTHALISVKRSASVNAAEETRAEAFAGFLQAPPYVEPGAVLRLAGLGLALPAIGQCQKAAPEAEAGAAVGRVELLEVGEVTLAAGGSVTTLAPRAFPSVTDSISGVVYTTRDRAAGPLPAASAYTVATTGSASLGPISVDVAAPGPLEGFELGGLPLAEVGAIDAGTAIELAWIAGAASDVVYVTFETPSSASTCAFRDADGHGTVPVSVLPGPSNATVSVHRLRTLPFADLGLTRGELRFDFAITAELAFE